MKKKLIIISSSIGIIILGTILYFAIKPEENKLISVNGSEVIEKLNNKDTFILVITQEGCSHCEEYLPILNRVLRENNINAYELDLRKVAKESEETQKAIATTFNTNAKEFGTPTTVFINDGTEKTIINRLVGSTSYSSLKKTLKERGFIE